MNKVLAVLVGSVGLSVGIVAVAFHSELKAEHRQATVLAAPRPLAPEDFSLQTQEFLGAHRDVAFADTPKAYHEWWAFGFRDKLSGSCSVLRAPAFGVSLDAKGKDPVARLFHEPAKLREIAYDKDNVLYKLTAEFDGRTEILYAPPVYPARCPKKPG